MNPSIRKTFLKPNRHVTLCIRADATQKIGTGHVMRCLALAQEARRNGFSALFIGHIAPSLTERLKFEGFQTFIYKDNLTVDEDLACLLRVAQGVSSVVIDHYALGYDYLNEVYDAAPNLLVIDDYNNRSSYPANLLLNQNISANRYLYNTKAKMLLGPRYCLLRSEFLKYPRKNAYAKKKIRKILVTMGGGNGGSQIFTVLKALEFIRIQDLHIKVVLGPAFSFHQKIEEFIDHSGLHVDVHSNVNNMAELYTWADAVITGGGSTIYEVAYFRLPAAIVCLADNQRDLSDELYQRGMVSLIDNKASISTIAEQLEHFIKNHKQAQHLAKAIGSITDGFGARRVMSKLVKRII